MFKQNSIFYNRKVFSCYYVKCLLLWLKTINLKKKEGTDELRYTKKQHKKCNEGYTENVKCPLRINRKQPNYQYFYNIVEFDLSYHKN